MTTTSDQSPTASPQLDAPILARMCTCVKVHTPYEFALARFTYKPVKLEPPRKNTNTAQHAHTLALTRRKNKIQGLLLADAGPAGCVCVIGALGFGLVFAVHKLLSSGGGGGSNVGIGNASASGGTSAEGSSGSKPLAYDGKLLNPCNMVSWEGVWVPLFFGDTYVGCRSTAVSARVRRMLAGGGRIDSGRVLCACILRSPPAVLARGTGDVERRTVNPLVARLVCNFRDSRTTANATHIVSDEALSVPCRSSSSV